jgi:hypothetical protein
MKEKKKVYQKIKDKKLNYLTIEITGHFHYLIFKRGWGRGEGERDTE